MGTKLAKAVCLLGLIGMAGMAQAQGIRLGGSLTQTFDLTDNDNLSGAGLTFGSRTGLGLSLTSSTPTTRIGASTGISLSFNNQGGGASVSEPQLNLSFGHDTKHIKYTAGLNYVDRPVAVDVTQPDLSVLRYSGDETRLTASLGASTQLNAQTGLSVSGSFTNVDFDPVSAGLFPSSNYSLSMALNRTVTPAASYGVSAKLGLFEAENTSNTTSVTADLAGNFTYQLDSITTAGGNLGLSFIETTDTVLGVESSNYSVAALFGANVSRQLPSGSLDLSFGQSVGPSSGGSLVISRTLSGNYSQTVNNVVSYGINLTLGQQENVGGGASTTFVSVAPTYTRKLTRDINANASYVLQRDNTGATSSGLKVSFSRAFDFAF